MSQKEKKKYKLDRTASQGMTAEEANHDMEEQAKKRSLQKRLEIAFYYQSIAYRFSLNAPPRMDRTAFTVISRNN